uniref:Uncharacterized protein n=1 Tax=Globodera rostochiensis TaxID=31243 RepID=A0A914GXG5_GLORO
MIISKIESRRFLHASAALCRGAVAQPGWYPRDHMPGAYPRNEEERRAAAIKYGLRPEDYRPHHPHDFINHIGDYPDVGIVAFEQRDPYDNYSNTAHRRNWNEPVKLQIRLFIRLIAYCLESYEPREVLKTLIARRPIFLVQTEIRALASASSDAKTISVRLLPCMAIRRIHKVSNSELHF